MNSVLLDLGFIQIYWYSAILFIAFLIGGALAINEAKKWKITEDYMINLFFFLIPIALIGARLYYVAFNFDYYQNNLIEIFKVWEGGLAIHGGIIAGVIFIIFYTKKYKVSTLRLLDILVVSLMLGQAIGRWGNFFNQEAYGALTTLDNLKNIHLPNFIIDQMFINGNYYQPTFLYESIFCFVGFIILLIFRNLKYTKIGMTTALYLIMYGIIRFFIEASRLDSLMLGNFKMAQIVSILMIIIGSIMLFVLRKGSVFQNQYNDKGNTNESTF